MRDYKMETEKRVKYICGLLDETGAHGIVFGNSGGKDSALVGILCKTACPNTVGLVMPCRSRRNFDEDMRDAQAVARQFDIELRTIDLSEAAEELIRRLGSVAEMSGTAVVNIAPRLRMTALYAVAASQGLLVAGTGNRSERYMGYFTKWGDGAYDFNPIADLTVAEIREYLRYLGAPQGIIDKAPSGGLFDGQTDEGDMGISYRSIDEFLLNGQCSPQDLEIISRYHNASQHKRNLPAEYCSG